MFKKLFGSKASSTKTAPTPALSGDVRKTVLSSLGLKAIPVMPGAAQKAFQLATNPKAEAHDFIDVIESDEALSARVLKIANSVFFDRGHGSKTITEAVQIIGTGELRGILNANALSDIFPSKHKLRSALWAHDVGVALTARLLARRFLPSRVDEVFLAGLMHDVGKLLMLQRHSDTFERLTKNWVRSQAESVVSETEEYPFDHTEVGQLIAEQWKFTPDLAAVIRNHHTRWEDLAPNSPTSIVKAANIIAHSIGLGATSESPSYRGTYQQLLPETWSALGIPPSEQKQLLEEARREFDSEYDLFASGGQR